MYNHRAAELRFQEDWEKEKTELVKAGATPEMIEEIYAFNRQVFNSDRRYYEHILDQDIYHVPQNDPHLIENPDPLDSFHWLDQISDPALYQALRSMPDDYLDILTLYAIYEYKVTEIAAMRGVAPSNISKKLARIRKIAKKAIQEGTEGPSSSARL